MLVGSSGRQVSCYTTVGGGVALLKAHVCEQTQCLMRSF